MNSENENELFQLASDVVNYTSRNLFLTGKAGTGKTTFLKYIKEHTLKNAVVIAPTGVAAINAGGVTMHSFFQLPFIPFVPQQNYFSGNVNSVDKHALIKGLRFSGQKIDILKELELLIIDEVSMLRADMLDAMDEILRHFRNKRNLPFGGVQVLFIGDLFQLPPVVSDDEVQILKSNYESPFFFSSKVLQENPLLFIELKKIYRQNEEKFIRLLNNIRNNDMNEYDYEMLLERYNSSAIDLIDETITLTTHNRTADNINQRELQKLEGDVYSFDAEIKNVFNEKSYPTEAVLYLKEGAQVMFIKNDSDAEKRYFNGKLATIKSIRDNDITVVLSGSGNELVLEKEKWKNIQYSLNSETGKIEEVELGSFTQYPVRLAWAITIHKSQGLTFDNAIIDAGQSFAAGQVYVALSRCRTLDGVVLLSKIYPQSVKNDERIIEFSQRENSLREIKNILDDEKPKYAAQRLIKLFDWDKIVVSLKMLETITKTKKILDKDLAENIVKIILDKAKNQQEISRKFSDELDKKCNEIPINQIWLETKVTGAKKYFSKQIHDELIVPLNTLQTYLKGKAKIKKYLEYVNETELFLWSKLNAIQRADFGEMTFEIEAIEMKKSDLVPAPKKQTEKGSSKLETLEMYKQKMSMDEIAKQRGMAMSTIESHLCEFVSTADVNVFDFVTEIEVNKIKELAAKIGFDNFPKFKASLPNEFTYGKIRMALNYLKKQKTEKK